MDDPNFKSCWNKYPDKPISETGKYLGRFEDLSSLENSYGHDAKYMDFVYMHDKIYPRDFSDAKLLAWMEIPY